ncbi:MAG: DUF502 domain-containing protein [Planctomycetota bacterium]|jgi:uncharacterized membrane protein
MGKIFRYFFQGLLVLLPTGLTVYLITYVLIVLDTWVNELLWKAMEWRCTGIGVPLALGVVLLVGFLVDLWLFRKLWRLLDMTFEKIPMVKSVYSTIRDTAEFLFGDKQSFSKVVLVDVPEKNHQVLGLVTNEDPGKETKTDMGGMVGIYVPMAFNLGGYTLYVPREKTTPVGMPVEEAMGFILSGGVTRAKVKD